jgi:hypothetical protein
MASAAHRLRITELTLRLASQEIARLLWDLKVHYRVHKSPLPVPIPSQINLIHYSIPVTKISIFRCSSRSSVSEEHVMGPPIFACRVFAAGAGNLHGLLRNSGNLWFPLLDTHCCATMGREAIVGTHC